MGAAGAGHTCARIAIVVYWIRMNDRYWVLHDLGVFPDKFNGAMRIVPKYWR
jgi:hypothetical protein